MTSVYEEMKSRHSENSLFEKMMLAQLVSMSSLHESSRQEFRLNL